METNQHKLPISQIFVRPYIPILINQRKCSSNKWFPYTLVTLCHSSSLHALLFEFEVEPQPSTGDDEHSACSKGKRLHHHILQVSKESLKVL